MKEPQEIGPEDEALAARAKSLFDESVASLDGQTQSRLNRARQAALAGTGGRQIRKGFSQWLPAAGVAAAAVVAAVLWFSRPVVEEIVRPTSVTDFEIILQEESFEMLEELEFYSWMDLDDDDEPVAPGSNVG